MGVLLDTHVCFQTHLHMQQHAAPHPCALRHTHRSSCVAARVKASAGMHAHQVTCCSELQAWSGHPTPSGPLPSRVPFGFEMELAKRTSVQAGFPQTFRLASSQPQFQLWRDMCSCDLSPQLALVLAPLHWLRGLRQGLPLSGPHSAPCSWVALCQTSKQLGGPSEKLGQ